MQTSVNDCGIFATPFDFRPEEWVELRALCVAEHASIRIEAVGRASELLEQLMDENEVETDSDNLEYRLASAYSALNLELPLVLAKALELSEGAYHDVMSKSDAEFIVVIFHDTYLDLTEPDQLAEQVYTEHAGPSFDDEERSLETDDEDDESEDPRVCSLVENADWGFLLQLAGGRNADRHLALSAAHVINENFLKSFGYKFTRYSKWIDIATQAAQDLSFGLPGNMETAIRIRNRCAHENPFLTREQAILAVQSYYELHWQTSNGRNRLIANAAAAEEARKQAQFALREAESSRGAASMADGTTPQPSGGVGPVAVVGLRTNPAPVANTPQAVGAATKGTKTLPDKNKLFLYALYASMLVGATIGGGLTFVVVPMDILGKLAWTLIGAAIGGFLGVAVLSLTIFVAYVLYFFVIGAIIGIVPGGLIGAFVGVLVAGVAGLGPGAAIGAAIGGVLGGIGFVVAQNG